MLSARIALRFLAVPLIAAVGTLHDAAAQESPAAFVASGVPTIQLFVADTSRIPADRRVPFNAGDSTRARSQDLMPYYILGGMAVGVGAVAISASRCNAACRRDGSFAASPGVYAGAILLGAVLGSAVGLIVEQMHSP